MCASVSLDIDEKWKEWRLGERSVRVQWIVCLQWKNGKRNAALGKDAWWIESKEQKVDVWLKWIDQCVCKRLKKGGNAKKNGMKRHFEMRLVKSRVNSVVTTHAQGTITSIFF